MSSAVTHNYSQAMVELASEKGILLNLQTTVSQMIATLQVPEMSQFLTHPKIPIAGKKDLINKILPDGTPQEFGNFINLLLDRRREGLLLQIMEETLDLTIQAQGFEIIELISAQPLSESKQKTIRTELETTWNTHLFVKYRQNTGLIGGIIIKRGDELIDGSLTGQLHNLRQVLLNEVKLSV